jgi:hypothetical protein
VDTAGLPISTRLIRDYSNFSVYRDFKVSPQSGMFPLPMKSIVICVLISVVFINLNIFIISYIS